MTPSFNCPVDWQWAPELSEEELAHRHREGKGSLIALRNELNQNETNNKQTGNPTPGKTLGIPIQI